MEKRTEERAESQEKLRRTEGEPLSRLFLTGFMGAGKSTVGAILAELLGWQFIDLDGFIEASNGRSVAEIFNLRGEAYFRGQEGRALQELSGRERLVLALGGGTIEDDSTRSFLLNLAGSCMVFLEAPLLELLGRCAAQPAKRPLLTTPRELEARHRSRLPHYRAAHITVPTADLAPDEVARRVLKEISRQTVRRGE